VNEVLDEIVASAQPVRAEVEGVFNARGGMTTRVVARHPSRSSGEGREGPSRSSGGAGGAGPEGTV
jgi:NADPH-dependent 7-cyano-7-deazaguanine reductase QueF